MPQGCAAREQVHSCAQAQAAQKPPCSGWSRGLHCSIVEGRLQVRNWQDKDGNKRKTTEVVADRMYFGDSKQEDKKQPAPADDFAEIEDDGDFPF